MVNLKRETLGGLKDSTETSKEDQRLAGLPSSPQSGNGLRCAGCLFLAGCLVLAAAAWPSTAQYSMNRRYLIGLLVFAITVVCLAWRRHRPKTTRTFQFSLAALLWFSIFANLAVAAYVAYDDWQTPRPQQAISWRPARITSVAFLAAEKLLVAANLEGDLGIFDPAAAQFICQVKASKYWPITSVRASRKGNRVVSCAPDGVYIWQCSRQQLTLFRSLSNNSYRSAEITEDGKIVVALDAGGAITLWDADTGHTLKGPEIVAGSLALAPERGRVFATIGNRLIQWDIHDGNTEESILFSTSPAGIEVSANGWIGLVDLQGTVQVWDLDRAQELGILRHDYLFAVLAPEGQYAALESYPGADIWQLGPLRGPVHLRTPYQVHALAFSADGRYIVAGDDHGSLYMWDTNLLFRGSTRFVAAIFSCCTALVLAIYIKFGKKLVRGLKVFGRPPKTTLDAGCKV